jgi:hypothetical protein
MKNKFTRLVALLVLLAFISSCGTTVYRGRAYKSNKYIGYKKHWFWWHEHHYRPHAHNGGYW